MKSVCKFLVNVINQTFMHGVVKSVYGPNIFVR